MRSVLLATEDASGGKSFGHAQRLLRRIALSGSAVSGTVGMDDIGRNCASKGLAAIHRYLTASQLEASRTLLRLDGQYGNGVVLSDVAGFAFVKRGKDYDL